MPITNADCGVWTLDEVYLKINANRWVCYNQPNDPGTLWSWGSNCCGELGQNDRVYRSSPVQVPGVSWTDINLVSGLKSDGTLWNWGTGFIGFIGDDTTVCRSSPVQIPGTSWITTASFGPFNRAARKSDGTLWTWGNNTWGDLGINDANTAHRSSPVQIPGTSWSVACGSGGIKTDGTLWMWGQNLDGQLGTNDIINRSSPVQIPGTTWVDIIAKVGTNDASFARKSDGTLWAWGRNTSGRLGTNDVINRSSPIQIPGTSWTEISAGGGGAAARKSDNTLWIWGSNNYGELGQNDRVSRSSPIQIPGTTWVQIARGGTHALARKSDGTLWAWGGSESYNAKTGTTPGKGELGQNNTSNRSSPVQIPGNFWIDISAGGNVSFARKSN